MADGSNREKLQQKGQTEMKHRILELYLDPWLTKISTVNQRVVFVDGFAGPGIYSDGWKGSPLRVMDIADQVISEYENVDQRLDEFKCIFVENDRERFLELKQNVDRHKQDVDDRINPTCIDDDFTKWAEQYIQGQRGRFPDPTLIFVDPFGYGEDIPFQLLSELFQLREKSYELLITFMAGKMAQYMGSPNHQKGITTSLGMSDWKNYFTEDMSKDEAARMFSHLYQRQWKETAGANYTLPFEMVEEGKNQICYHLIHVTNHIDGLKVMKKNMFNAGANDQYAYLGPNHVGFEDEQLSLAKFGESMDFNNRIETFAEELHESYLDDTITFQRLLEETLDKNVYLPQHYRSTFKKLENRDKLKVFDPESAEEGTRSGTAYKPEFELEFVQPMTLDQFG